MVPGTRRYGTNTNYTEETLTKALEEIKSGTKAIKEASRDYNIPRNTLKNKMKNRHGKNVGRPIIFTQEEEMVFVQHVMAVSDLGVPMTMYDLRCVIQQYLKNNKITKCDKFKNKMPGWDWGEGFLSRHPELKASFARNISRKRAQVDKEKLDGFFENLEKELDGVPAQNIFNYDETGFHDNPQKGKYLFRRTCRNPEIIRNSTKSCYTVVFCANAAGEMLPPYFIFKGINKMSNWILDGPKGCRMNASPSGWIDLNIFEDWFVVHLLPQLKKLPGKKVIIGDNLAAHLNVNVLKICRENNISFVFLVPNATHLIQPLDVGVFAPLKSQWRSVLKAWRDSPQGIKSVSMPNNVFSYLVKKTLDGIAPNLSQNIQRGFKSTGIFPTDRQHVLAKLPTYSNEVENEGNVSELVGLEFKAFLSALRSENLAPQQRGKRFQMPVTPGKSVSLQEVEEYVQNRADKKTKGKKKKISSKSNKECVPEANSSRQDDKEFIPKGDKKRLQKNQTQNQIKKNKVDNGNIDDQAAAEDLDMIIMDGGDVIEDTVQDDLDFDGEIDAFTFDVQVDVHEHVNLEETLVSETSKEEFRINDYVVVNYEGSFFPGVITGFQQEDSIKVIVSAMSLNGKYWRWPTVKDEIWYEESDVIKKIQLSHVTPVNARGDFKVDDAFLNEKWGINFDTD